MKSIFTTLFVTSSVVLLAGCVLQNKAPDDTQVEISWLDNQPIQNNQPIQSDTWIIQNTYRKIDSTAYDSNKKENWVYEICLNTNKWVCIDLLEYTWTFKDYYISLLPLEESNELEPNRKPVITTTIQWKKERKCSAYMESSLCFQENSKGTLIMIISNQKWEWFHGWEYDPKEILKVIDF
jgi:hypothetical protein